MPSLAAKILTRNEVKQVLSTLRFGGNLIIFRLSLCCGLRRREICGLQMRDMQLFGPRPEIHIRKELGKGRNGGKARYVPLWWDEGTLDDLELWHTKRVGMGAGDLDPFLCSTSKGTLGKPLSHTGAAARWKTAVKCLGKERQDQLHIHCGRHSFASHYALVGRSLPEIKEAMGHSNISTTSIYLGLLEREGVESGFKF
jgi:integrase/recombinase XerD